MKISVHTDMRMIKKIGETFGEIAFPVTCACCGSSTSGNNRYICHWCTYKRFERAEIDLGEIKPENVSFVYAMWHFDKGGYLQDLLHNLKYNFLRGVGEELGKILAQRFLESANQELKELIDLNKPIIIPVPLHKSKKRQRGYNQARAVSLGISMITNWEVIGEDQVIRRKKTQTQTGLNTSQRNKNLKDAFLVKDQNVLAGRFSVIVDDVFTTGATTFELANTIDSGSEAKTGILTVAKA